MFRKVGAFVYIMSALVSMEGCLSDIEKLKEKQPESTDSSWSQWETLPASDRLRLLHLIFNTLCVAMRYEPANAKFFQQEV